jgi:hypothetical protein
MFVKLRRGDSEQVFSFWGYGETTKLSAGSGLFVGQSGVTYNHHFVLSVHKPEYRFAAGSYSIQVFARAVGRSLPMKLNEISLAVSSEEASLLNQQSGVLFELDPVEGTYTGHSRDGISP